MTKATPLALALLAAVPALLSGCFGGSGGPEVPGPCPAAPSMPAPQERPNVAADPGPDFEVLTGDSVFLDGTASRDAQGRPLVYHWDQVEGPCVALDESNPAMPAFTAPPVPTGGSVLKFRLVVQAGQEYSPPSYVHVFVGRTEAGPST